MNKDLNGGFGTKDHYGNSITSKLLMWIKKRGVRLPVITMAYLQAIFKAKGTNVNYYEGTLPASKQHPDLILIYGSIVDYENENEQAKNLKKLFPFSRIGFVGPFPSTYPQLFNTVDFVLQGEPEAYFLNEFDGLDFLSGVVQIRSQVDMDTLPTPDYDGFPISSYNYKPIINKTPFLVLQASKGCPYSCRFYCVYGQFQGAKIRQRSAKKVVDDMEILQRKYNVKGIQFRDPLFGVTKNFIEELVHELTTRKLNIIWGMETRLDLLNEKNLAEMYNVGLRNINVGIETFNQTIAKNNRRLLVEEVHQKNLIAFCKNKGINVSAFYILGLEGDTKQTIESTVNYAIKLNTLTARFSISTPYPGTGYYAQLEKEDRLLTKNFQLYDQFTLVYKHSNITPPQLQSLMDWAYRKYYFRLSYFLMLPRLAFRLLRV
jgi:anaerobic magnesium-protoporphyrin IX monomethyl ester cyclase